MSNNISVIATSTNTVVALEGSGAPNLPSSNPVTVVLTIGNNIGSVTVNAEFQ